MLKNILRSQAIKTNKTPNNNNKKASRLDLSHGHSLATLGINQATYTEFMGDLGNFQDYVYYTVFLPYVLT